MRIRNVFGTTNRRCPNCGTWKQHWLDHSGRSWPRCQVSGCLSRADVGAHVTIVGRRAEHRILPMCHAHNRDDGDLTVRFGAALIWANVRETCGRPRQALRFI